MARRASQALVDADARDKLALDHVTDPGPAPRGLRRSSGSAHGRYLAEHIAGARYVELPGADTLYWVGDTMPILAEIEEFITGSRGGWDAERVLTTIVFTDIVASTQRAAALGDDRWRDLLDSHDSLVRRELRRFGGREVNTAGDGFVATFSSPSVALDCAEEIVDAVRTLGIEVRVGIHAGEVEVRGQDIAGMAVHIGARVAALAGPSEVLVSSTVREIVTGSHRTFTDRGEHELKGVPGRWCVYARDLSSDRAAALSRCRAVGFVTGEPAPVVRRRHADDPAEVVAQQRGGAEARPVGHAVDVEIGLLEQPPGIEHALIGDPLHGRAPGLVDEPAGEGPRRHAGALCERRDGVRLVEVGQDPIQLRRKAFRTPHRDGLIDVLALATVALRRHDHPAGDDVGDLAAQFASHQVQAGVDARGGARAGDQVAVVDEQDVAVDLRGRDAARASASACIQCVVHLRPSSRPAAPTTKAPEQTVRMIDPERRRRGPRRAPPAGSRARRSPGRRPDRRRPGRRTVVRVRDAPTVIRSGRPAPARRS